MRLFLKPRLDFSVCDVYDFRISYTFKSLTMRTNIDIDDSLMRRAMQVGGADTKKGTVETALRLLIQTRSQVGMRRSAALPNL